MEEYHDRSLRGRVFQKLREDILSGVYKEHEELREITIGEELGVSRTPVREALRQLELEGLVTIIPNKGAYVTGITPKDVYDIYKIRSMLEGVCARWATEHITEKQIEELEEVLLLSEFHLQKKGEEKAEQVTELDGKFHKVLYEASDSRILEHVLSDFHKYVQMARALSVGEKNRAQKSVQEHREILEAIRNRDMDLAEELANRHILNVMENLHLSKQEDRTAGR
ncbi:MAG: GntR family transcriptional regulator [Dorea sp.]|jgi:DNA-binding GntR family transcriptional regulator|nr:GntR family transcriptional regulator [Dorea sp.]